MSAMESQSSKHPSSTVETQQPTLSHETSSTGGGNFSAESRTYTNRLESTNSDFRFLAMEQLATMNPREQLQLSKDITRLNQDDLIANPNNPNLPEIQIEMGPVYPSDQNQIVNIEMNYFDNDKLQQDQEANQIAFASEGSADMKANLKANSKEVAEMERDIP